MLVQRCTFLRNLDSRHFLETLLLYERFILWHNSWCSSCYRKGLPTEHRYIYPGLHECPISSHPTLVLMSNCQSFMTNAHRCMIQKDPRILPPGVLGTVHQDSRVATLHHEYSSLSCLPLPKSGRQGPKDSWMVQVQGLWCRWTMVVFHHCEVDNPLANPWPGGSKFWETHCASQKGIQWMCEHPLGCIRTPRHASWMFWCFPLVHWWHSWVWGSESPVIIPWSIG